MLEKIFSMFEVFTDTLPKLPLVVLANKIAVARSYMLLGMQRSQPYQLGN